MEEMELRIQNISRAAIPAVQLILVVFVQPQATGEVQQWSECCFLRYFTDY
jgi:hypothetical protein